MNKKLLKLAQLFRSDNPPKVVNFCVQDARFDRVNGKPMPIGRGRLLGNAVIDRMFMRDSQLALMASSITDDPSNQFSPMTSYESDAFFGTAAKAGIALRNVKQISVYVGEDQLPSTSELYDGDEILVECSLDNVQTFPLSRTGRKPYQLGVTLTFFASRQDMYIANGFYRTAPFKSGVDVPQPLGGWPT